MSDLISRKALIETFEVCGFNQEAMIPIISIMKILEIANQQPTAYDVDKEIGAIDFLRKAKAIEDEDDKMKIVDKIIRCVWNMGEIDEADPVSKVMGYEIKEGDNAERN